MNADARHSIADLSRLADVSPRTVRYYVAQGLLPGPRDAGPAATYGAGHLDRLRLIRLLQGRHQPLAEIRSRLETLDDAQVSALLAETAGDPPDAWATAGSALDYVRAVLAEGPPRSHRPVPAPPPAAPLAQRARAVVAAAADATRTPLGFVGEAAPRPASPPPAPDAAAAPPTDVRVAGAGPPAATPPAAQSTRSQWDRIPLAADLELHVRRPLSRLTNRRVERLITIARQILREDQP